MATIGGASLHDGDLCQIILSGGLVLDYYLDATSGATEDNYFIVEPDTVPGSKRWLLRYPMTGLNKVSIGMFGNNLATALTAIGSKQMTLEIDSNIALTSSVTDPNNVNIEIGSGGVIALGNYNLVINGNFSCPPSHKCFSYTGSGVATFGAGAVKEAYPQWWGAKGDGITIDRVALNACLTQSYCKKYIPKTSGNYITTTPIIISSSDQYIEFEKGAYIQLGDGYGTDPGINEILILTGNNITIKNLGIDGNQGNNVNLKAHGVSVKGNNITLYDPVIHDIPDKGLSGGDGIFIYNDCNNINIINPKVVDEGRNGISVVDAHNVYIKNIYSTGCGHASVDAENNTGKVVKNIVVDGGYISGSNYGLLGIGDANASYISFTFKNVTIESVISQAIGVRSADNFIIDNNTILTPGYRGIFLQCDITYPYVINHGQITNNKIYSTDDGGIYLVGYDNTNKVKNVIVAGNTVDTTGHSEACILSNWCDRVNIIGNICNNSNGTTIAVSNIKDSKISGNTIYNSTIHGIQISGGAESYNNILSDNIFNTGVGNALQIYDCQRTTISGNRVTGFANSLSYRTASTNINNSFHNNIFKSPTSLYMDDYNTYDKWTLDIPEPIEPTWGIAIPSNMNVHIPKGGFVTLLNSNFVINGTLEAGPYQIFSYTGTGRVSGTVTTNQEMLPQWFGWAGVRNITYGTAAPTTGTYTIGNIIYDSTPVSSQPQGWTCTTSGTFSAATDATGDTDGSTAVITGMTDTSDFFIGEYATVSAGFASTGPYRILIITATTMTLDTNSNSAQSDITVSTTDPVFNALPNLP